ncbi:hypothetical protein EVAR_43731_1 [Eumeta japonica]|uniref:Uncharacterized protein n=1 Tax=Eumeta variegata TaxID=151549 RepID=A0A4C1Y267_EUMVA|nr:hypothetical protein EVAR_43731_1 [Eumeta japonica]
MIVSRIVTPHRQPNVDPARVRTYSLINRYTSAISSRAPRQREDARQTARRVIISQTQLISNIRSVARYTRRANIFGAAPYYARGIH